MTDGISGSGPILVVEDEALIAFDLVDMLEDLGFEDVEVASTFESAEQALSKKRFDVVFFDLNLGGTLSTPLIERAAAEGIYTVVASGYEARTVPTSMSGSARLMKPYDAKMVRQILAGRAKTKSLSRT